MMLQFFFYSVCLSFVLSDPIPVGFLGIPWAILIHTPVLEKDLKPISCTMFVANFNVNIQFLMGL